MPNQYSGNPTNPNRVTGLPPAPGVQFKLNIPVDSDPNNATTLFNEQYADIADSLQFCLDGYGHVEDGYTTIKGIFIDGIGGQPVPDPPSTIANAIYFDSNGTNTGVVLKNTSSAFAIQNLNPSGSLLLKGNDLSLDPGTSSSSFIEMNLNTAGQKINIYGPASSVTCFIDSTGGITTQGITTLNNNLIINFPGVSNDIQVFNHLHTEIYSLDDIGNGTYQTGGLTLNEGTFTAVAGHVEVTAGGITVGSGLTPAAGIIQSTGDIITTVGDIDSGHDIFANNNIFAETGSITAIIGNLQGIQLVGLNNVSPPTTSLLGSGVTSATVTGNAMGFRVSVLIGGSNITTNISLFTLTFNTTFANNPIIVSSEMQNITGAFDAACQIDYVSLSPTSFKFMSRGDIVTLTAAHTYVFNFITVGY